MEQKIAYHVVTDRPMRVGQVIVFDDAHPSGVCRRVMDKLPIVEEIYAHPQAYQGIELEHHTAVALRELALEEVRARRFPDYPSRLGCLYVSRQLEETQRWAELFVEWGRPTYQIVKLGLGGRLFTGDANNCFQADANREENLRLAQRYWENAPSLSGEPPIWEVLADGPLVVLEIVREINRNL